MATYLISTLYPAAIIPGIVVMRHTRNAAHRAAYDLWREHLSTSGGLDTLRGWKGVKELEAWAANKEVSVVNDDCIKVEDRSYDFEVNVRRTA